MNSPKKTTSGLSIPPQTVQSGTRNPSVRLGQHIAVRPERDVLGDRDPGVVGLDAHGEVAAVEHLTAVRAEDPAHGAVQFDDAAAAGAQVQAVDVLRDDAGRDAAGLEVGERAVTGVGLRRRRRRASRDGCPPSTAGGPARSARNCSTVMGVRTGAPLPR